MRAQKRLILVDGNALIHRAYHALPPLTTKKGELVNAVYGFSTLLLKAIHDLKPDYAVVAFDLAGPTFRHETYKEYKATRVKQPDDLYQQFDRVKEIVRALNIPIFEIKGFEADDVIGTLSCQATKQALETIIVTGDMDTLQLVNPSVKVYTARRGFTDTVIYDEQSVAERYGVPSSQFVDYKALKGDDSDNIPGVAGIGDKTASALIAGFGSLDNLYAWLESHRSDDDLKQAPCKITPRIRDILLASKEQAYQSRHLSEIVCDVPMVLDLKEAQLESYDRQKAIALFAELEFQSLLGRLPAASDLTKSPGPTSPANNSDQQSLFDPPTALKDHTLKDEVIATNLVSVKYQLVQTATDLDYLAKTLKKAKVIAFDTETDQLHGPIIGLSFATKAGQAWYVPVNLKLLKTEILDKLKPILEDSKIAKVGHNLKYDYLTLLKEGIAVASLTFDTMIAAYLLNPGNRQHGLDAVAFVELGIEKIPLTRLIGEKKLESLTKAPVEAICQYACEDADVSFRLYNHFEPQIKKQGLSEVFNQFEMPLISILAKMEAVGIKLDTAYLAKLSKKLAKRVEELRAEIYETAGQEFNVNSPSQMATILFEKLGLHHPDLKKTKTGLSTAAAELEKLRGSHPIIELLFEYRELTKLLSTYIDALPTLVDKNDRLHTSFNQTVAATGRLSSSDPNLQNIPIRTELGRSIRRAFICEPGYCLLAADYSQIELRVVAHLAGDAALLSAFKAGRDIHQEVADTLGVDRRVGKTLNFAILYGQGPYSTAGQLGISMAKAKEHIERYFEVYTGVRQFLDTTLRLAREQGYVSTLTGRRRYIPEILSSNFSVRGAAERMAANMPIQGTAADIIKKAMIDLDASNTMAKSRARLLLQVHDELVFEVPAKEVAAFGAEVKKAMESAYRLDVPLQVEVKAGDNWEEMSPL